LGLVAHLAAQARSRTSMPSLWRRSSLWSRRQRPSAWAHSRGTHRRPGVLSHGGRGPATLDSEDRPL